MANRYRNDSEYDRTHPRRGDRQQEQFESDRQYQPGESNWRNGRYRDDELIRSETTYRTDYQPLDDYDRASFGSQSRFEEMGQTHRYFRPDDFGGEDYTRGRYGAAGMNRPNRGYGYRGRSAAFTPERPGRTSWSDADFDRGARSDRGFFERAGDEIASWFGDDEAERRRRMDHRGRGPANYERSNERLLEDACERLTHDPLVDARNINVTVAENEVTLDGTVSNRAEKRRAEDSVHDIVGVKHVQNNLRIDERDDWSSRTDQTGSKFES